MVLMPGSHPRQSDFTGMVVLGIGILKVNFLL